ncbi:MAG: hypothetical protein QMD04_00580 [Anaerolineales bacterium]|nr:hypothetical protein [Anaerolineales bacterium]
MGQSELDAKNLATAMDAELRSLPLQNTPNERAVRRKYSQLLKKAAPEFVLGVARELFKTFGQRWTAYEIIAAHKPAFQSLGEAEIEELGQGIHQILGSIGSFVKVLVNLLPELRQLGCFVHALSLPQFSFFVKFCQKSKP